MASESNEITVERLQPELHSFGGYSKLRYLFLISTTVGHGQSSQGCSHSMA